jgi:superfamily II DNA or RNA helicase
MELSERCAKQFSQRDWQAAEEYYRRGAVRLLECSPTDILVEVSGTSTDIDHVRLDWSDAADHRMMFVECSCPEFDGTGICKHIAAAIRFADAMDIGALVPGKGQLDVEPDPTGIAGDGPFHDSFEIDDDNRWNYGPGGARQLYEELNGFLQRKFGVGAGAAPPVKGEKKPTSSPAPSVWKTHLSAIANQSANERAQRYADPGRTPNKPREIWYVLDVSKSLSRARPVVSLWQRVAKKDGTPGKLKTACLSKDEVDRLPSSLDRTLLGLLAGNEREAVYSYGYSRFSDSATYSEIAVAPAMFDLLFPRLCASEKFGWLPEKGTKDDNQLRLLAWDDGPAWKMQLSVTKSSDQKHWQMTGRLQRGDETAPLSHPLLLLTAGLVVFPDRIARFDPGDDFQWTATLRKVGQLLVPVEEGAEFAEQLSQMAVTPGTDWPGELRWEEERPVPVPQLKISQPTKKWVNKLECRLSFQYGPLSASFGEGNSAWFDRQTRRAVRRDLHAESDAREQLVAGGAIKLSYYDEDKPGLYFLPPEKLPRLVHQLTAAGWKVDADGREIRRPGPFSISLTGGIDWFDLEGACDFGGTTATLPALLAALKRGDRFIELDDGSRGILPEEWLARYAPLALLGQAEGDRLRFLPTQAGLLDAMLAAQESNRVTVDEAFAKLRDKLRSFEGVQPRTEPPSFQGELRPYQREGLGWLHFLDEFGFGGCLADDMGLGKTVQVLAFLDGRRQQNAAAGQGTTAPCAAETSPGPSIVVVPRSLVFNWIEEARRFTPGLRILNYTGLERAAALDQVKNHDLIITTYGTLRKDIVRLCEIAFDYAILDEAQAIKNPASLAAKACRLIKARRRLAMTGTPVENHLGELWSLFEFLNPGMLGRQQKRNDLLAPARQARMANAESGTGNAPAPDLSFLARALRPFMLRRTKQQVLSELPSKTEQTLYCELGADQRVLYDELRDHYRRSLTDRVDKVGLNKSKIHVLEALLRLRQAACHPGLLDKKKIDAGSSKLETLLEQLAEVVDGGHKVLVFSQFTSLLAIARKELDQRKIVYEYLDGKTAKRQAKVERFQTDPDCRVFLISLKAGGLGLNLTAADYVFILDPWWNPAVEAQAVDRAHRIGQNRHVIAYRLIARDTVEEKILNLQQHKRGLAKAIVSADNNLLRNLTADDLQLLLS